MTTHQISTIHDDLGDALEQIASGHPILLQCGETALGALVSMEDLRLLEHYIDALEDKTDLDEARKALDEVATSGTQSYESFRRELGL